MKHIKRIVVLVSAAIALCGCGVTANMTSNVNNNVTNVTLASDNFRIINTVDAQVSSRYLFGIGGLSKKALRDNAVAELTKKAQLHGSQALINVTVKQSAKFFLVYNVVTYYAEGTVIQFYE